MHPFKDRDEVATGTWGSSAGLSDVELLMRRAAVAARLPGKDGGLYEGLRHKETWLEEVANYSLAVCFPHTFSNLH